MVKKENVLQCMGNKKEQNQKNKWIKTISSVSAMILLAGILGGCGAANKAADSLSDTGTSTYAVDSSESATLSNGYQSEGAVLEDSAMSSQETVADPQAADTTTAQENVKDARKLIKTVDMNVETESYDQLMTNIQNKVKALGGYIENMNTSGTADAGGRDGYISARVPADQVDQFVTDVTEISNITYKNESVEDVTLTYVDLDSHKKMLQAEADRLIQMMDQAETMEDIISIESRLTDVRYQIESMESQLRTYDNQIDYSTVHISISEVRTLTVVPNRSAWERMSSGFMNSVNDVCTGCKEFGIGFVIFIPYLIVIAIIVLIFVFIIRLLIKRGEKHIAREHEKYQHTMQNQTNGYAQNPYQQNINQQQMVQQVPQKPQNTDQPQMGQQSKEQEKGNN